MAKAPPPLYQLAGDVEKCIILILVVVIIAEFLVILRLRMNLKIAEKTILLAQKGLLSVQRYRRH